MKKLGLKKSHRDALVKNLITSLVLHDRIKTTQSRAKAVASRFARMMRVVQTKEKREAIRVMPQFCTNIKVSQKIVNELKTKYENRRSGFTRITRLGLRKGDSASLVQIELV